MANPASLRTSSIFNTLASDFLAPEDQKELETSDFRTTAQTIDSRIVSPSLRFFLQAYEAEKKGDYSLAMHHYISVAEVYGRSGKQSICLKLLQKAEELANKVRSQAGICNFFERLEVTLLKSLSLYSVARLKDELRIPFNEKVKEICPPSSQRKPTCFICFNAEEMDVRQWLNYVLIPDLKAAGIDPWCSLEKLTAGKDVLEFEARAGSSDYVIVICTPELKRKATEVSTSGVYREIQNHINQRLQEGKIWPILFKGSHSQSCPSSFSEKWGVTATPYDYYKILEVYFAFHGLNRSEATKAIDVFVEKGNQLYFSRNRPVIPITTPSLPPLPAQAVRSLDEWQKMPRMSPSLPLPNRHYFQREGIDLDNAFCFSNVVALVPPLFTICRTGKTATAIHYARNTSRYDRIFWIDASDPACLQKESASLKEELSRPGFLLVLDQATSWETVERYFPHLRQNLLGHILITSRKRDWEGAATIEAHPFSNEEALTMLQEMTGRFEPDEASSKLIETFEGVPAFIRKTATLINEQKISFGTAFDQIMKREKEIKLLKLRGNVPIANICFGRADEIDFCDKWFQENKGPFFLSGEDKTGKTTFAQFYALLHARDYKILGYISYENLVPDYQELAKKFGWKEGDPIQFVHRLLEKEEGLLIFDNVMQMDQIPQIRAKLIIITATPPETHLRLNAIHEKASAALLTYLAEKDCPSLIPYVKGNLSHIALVGRWLKQGVSEKAALDCLKLGKRKWEEHIYPLIKQETEKRTLFYKQAVIPFFELLFACRRISLQLACTHLHKNFGVPFEGKEIICQAIIAILEDFFPIKQTNDSIILDMEKEIK